MAVLLVTITLVVLLVALWAYAYIKTRRQKTKHGLRTVPVHGILIPVNFLFNAIRVLFGVQIIKIKSEEFIKRAKQIAADTDPEIFGPQEDFIEGVTLWVTGPDQSLMSGSGIILFNGLTERLLNTRRWVVEYIQQNREAVLNAKLESPLIVSGLPRTGSTMLYNLLSCDPDARTPRFFEMSQMANPMPPTTETSRDTDPRIAAVSKRFEETEKLFPGMWTEAGKSHRSHPNEIEEDLLVLFHSMIMQLQVPLAGDLFRVWYEKIENKRFAYIYHRLFFQALTATWKPRSHWVLKAPVHSTYLPELIKQYPDARLVFTHREPSVVIPSWTRFLEAYLHWSYLDYAFDRVKFGRYITDSLLLCGERLMEFQKTLKPEQYLDIKYNEFVKDPINTVKDIYNHFGMKFTPEFEENMKEWIKENRQGKYGRRDYFLTDYNLTKEDINKEFAKYNAQFL